MCIPFGEVTKRKFIINSGFFKAKQVGNLFMSKVPFLKFEFNSFFHNLNIGFAWHGYEKIKKAAKENLEIVKEFTEKASGTKEDRVVMADCLSFLKDRGANILLISEISRLGRTVKIVVDTIDLLNKAGVDVYIQDIDKHTLNPDGKPDQFTAMMITMMSLGAQMEREAITHRLNSGRSVAKDKGVKMGRKVGSVKTKDKKRREYQKVISCLKDGQSVRNTAKISNVSQSTVQRIKKEFEL